MWNRYLHYPVVKNIFVLSNCETNICTIQLWNRWDICLVSIEMLKPDNVLHFASCKLHLGSRQLWKQAGSSDDIWLLTDVSLSFAYLLFRLRDCSNGFFDNSNKDENKVINKFKWSELFCWIQNNHNLSQEGASV